MRNDVILHNWLITADCDSFENDYLESIFFCGNGRMGLRGFSPYSPTPRPIQTGLFIAGVFGEIKPGITDFVNLPNPAWEQLALDGEVATLISPIHRELNLATAELTLRYTLAAGGKQVEVSQLRFFPLDNPALLVQRTTVIANKDTCITLTSGIELDNCNNPIPDDQVKENIELIKLAELTASYIEEDCLTCEFVTVGTNIHISQTVQFAGDEWTHTDNIQCERHCAITWQAACHAGVSYSLDKLCCITTSRDCDPRIQPLDKSAHLDTLQVASRSAQQQQWQHCAIELDGDDDLQTAIRYSLLQLNMNCSPQDDSVNIGARGLTHTRYKGCYFWDTDMFMLPFYLYTNPQAARSLAGFRTNTLPQAREHACKMNGDGARYPWMVSFDGSEQCESWDIGASELHITADVVFAINQYITATGDNSLLADAAAVYVETARFWQSRYSPSPDGNGVNLLFCKGPDEYCGITNNNLFTNWMVKHNLELAIEAIDWLAHHDKALYTALGLSPIEATAWRLVCDGIKLPRDPISGNWRTDDTFHLLEPVDVATLKPDDTASYHRVCFDRVQRYRVVKQADVLLLMSRFPSRFTATEKLAAWQDFEPLCLHDSTLSFASHALFAAQNGLTSEAKNYFDKAIFLDLREIMHNTGKEGLHLANLGECWQAIVFGFAGLSFDSGVPMLCPQLPDGWHKLSFVFAWQGRRYCAEIEQGVGRIVECTE